MVNYQNKCVHTSYLMVILSIDTYSKSPVEVRCVLKNVIQMYNNIINNEQVKNILFYH